RRNGADVASTLQTLYRPAEPGFHRLGRAREHRLRTGRQFRARLDRLVARIRIEMGAGPRFHSRSGRAARQPDEPPRVEPGSSPERRAGRWPARVHARRLLSRSGWRIYRTRRPELRRHRLYPWAGYHAEYDQGPVRNRNRSADGRTKPYRRYPLHEGQEGLYVLPVQSGWDGAIRRPSCPPGRRPAHLRVPLWSRSGWRRSDQHREQPELSAHRLVRNFGRLRRRSLRLARGGRLSFLRRIPDVRV